MKRYVLPRPDGSGWGIYMPETEQWMPGTWEDEETATAHVEKELSRPLRDRLWEWLRAHPKATIGDACRAFDLTPVEFLAVRDGVQTYNQRRKQ